MMGAPSQMGGPDSFARWHGRKESLEVNMRKLDLEEWEKTYIQGEVERFDQKNQMFNRPGWDAEINRMLEDWSFTGEVNGKPGYTMEDMALRWASRRGTMLQLFNMNKPNPAPVTKAIMGAIKASNPNMPFARYTPPEGMKVDVSDPRTITDKIKKVALWSGADLVGICRLDRRWVYSHTYTKQPYTGPGGQLDVGESLPQEIGDGFQYAVVMAFAQDYELIKCFPSYIAAAATSMGYSRMAIANNYLTAFIKNMGFNAIDCTTNDVALTIPMAAQAGLGELGRFGLLITHKYGPNVRLSKVITDLPMVTDAPVEFGVTQFCESCEICAEMCPSQSIMYGERTTEPNNISNRGGVLRWPINAETCRAYWSRMNCPCTACVAGCPYTKPHTLFHRTIRWLTDHARWGDPLYVWGDRLMGYSKPWKPEEFWEKWQPNGKRNS